MTVHGRRMVVAGIGLVLLLAACAPGSGRFVAEDPAGFFSGVWHGWIAPITLIWQIFNSDIRVYEPFNTGWWYDFGFYIAIISGFGSLSLSRTRRRKARKAE
ncbi:MAG: hypothetical protein OEM97_03210 [Acidimicrobiia bacterium]|nr:hypothetical protein [Acidimicrobiia bacterium]